MQRDSIEPMTHMTGTVMVFVDAAYLYAVVRHHHGVAHLHDLVIDYAQLAETLRAKITAEVGPVLRIRWYDATDPRRILTNPRAAGMAAVAGVRLVEGHLVERDGVLHQKAVDTRLVADMCTIAHQHQVEQFVVLTGDEDMVPGVEAAQDVGLRVEVWSLEVTGGAPTVSRELINLADRHRPVNVAELADVISPATSTLHDITTAPVQEPATPAAPSTQVLPIPDGSAPGPVDAEAAPEHVASSGMKVTPAILAELSPARSRVTSQTERMPTLWGIDQAGYNAPLPPLEGTPVQLATHAGATYAARWWTAAGPAVRRRLGELCPGTGEFEPIPAELDGDLLRFAEEHRVDTWGSVQVKNAVRVGFWDEVATLATPHARA